MLLRNDSNQEIGLIAIYQVNTTITTCPRLRHIVVAPEQFMFRPAPLESANDATNAVDGWQYRPAAADVLHPRELHVMRTPQLRLD